MTLGYLNIKSVGRANTPNDIGVRVWRGEIQNQARRVKSDTLHANGLDGMKKKVQHPEGATEGQTSGHF